MAPQWVVTEVSHPQSCVVCSGSTHPGLMVARTPGSDVTEELVPCPHCAGAWWFFKFLEGSK